MEGVDEVEAMGYSHQYLFPTPPVQVSSTCKKTKENIEYISTSNLP